jgi:hypothetical protein
MKHFFTKDLIKINRETKVCLVSGQKSEEISFKLILTSSGNTSLIKDEEIASKIYSLIEKIDFNK